MNTQPQAAASRQEDHAAPRQLGHLPRLMRLIDRRASSMSEQRARERIASLAVLTLLQVATALLVLSHAPEGSGAHWNIAFILSLCMISNAALVMLCRRRISMQTILTDS